MKDPRDMREVVINGELSVDQGGHSVSGPYVGTPPKGHGALEQQLQQFSLLLTAHSCRSARGGANLQPCLPEVIPSVTPAHHRTGVASDAPSDLVEGDIFDEHLDCSSPPRQQYSRGTLRSHGEQPLPGCPYYIALIMLSQ